MDHLPSGASTSTVRYIQLADILPSRERDRARVLERYQRRFEAEYAKQPQMLSENRPEAGIRLPELTQWLGRVVKRIDDSVAPIATLAAEPGRWLSESVADAGLRFFRGSADLLPNEPFIYASAEGDLVAEFKAPRGALTSIVSPKFIVLFADVDGEILHVRLGANACNAVEPLREELKRFREALVAGPDGKVDAAGE